ncbi:hypothetical protein PVAND_008616 [Polypedilum vanderplanki]|uniref:Uncharacterized protein n=1 Tax=Polypedilum vanderplanki TaxID=319348 RepID=A0A9J6CAI6_POLVA|nr:hypothetical protein PVAND_008616 [Polypedilum vanderplanki]
MLVCKVLSVLFSSHLIFVKSNLLPESNFGKYFEVNLDRFEILYENKSIWEWHLKVRKVNKTRSIVGYVLTKVPIGDDFKSEGRLLKKQGGEYRYLPYGYPPTPKCTLMANDRYMYPDVAKNSDFPADVRNNCPDKPRNYSVYGVSFSLNNVPKVIVPSGDYAAEAIYYDPHNNIAGKYRIYSTIIQV